MIMKFFLRVDIFILYGEDMPSIRSIILRNVMKKGLDFNKPLIETRKNFEKLSTSVKIPKDVVVEILDDEIKGELIIPSNAPKDKIIYFAHGGGYCLGIYNATRNHIYRVAKLLNRRIFMIDYRLAPENPYPAGLNDTINGYNYLLDKGYKPKNICLYGESAGCGLLLSTLVNLRDNNIEMPACSFFSTPFLDCTMSGKTVINNAEKDPYYCDKEFYISNNYIGDYEPDSPEISPVYEDLNNLPPFLVHGAEYDMLLCNSTDFVNKVNMGNGKADLKVWKGMWHVFHINADLIPEGKKAIKEFGEYIEGF